MNYFDTERLQGFLARVGALLRVGKCGVFLGDIHLQADNEGWEIGLAMGLISQFSKTHLHYESVELAESQIRAQGFRSVVLHAPSAFAKVIDCLPAGASLNKIVEAWV